MLSLSIVLGALVAHAGSPTPSAPTASPSLAGVWTVEIQATHSTCPAATTPSGTQTLQWIVSVDATGQHTAAVQGETAFPRLRGASVDGVLVLSGLERDGALPAATALVLDGTRTPVHAQARTTFRLRLENGTLVGDRVTATIPAPQVAGAAATLTPCVVESAVTARRG